MRHSHCSGGKPIRILSIFYFCAVSVQLINAEFVPEDLIVEAGPLGKIRGIQATTAVNQRYYIAFFGIPYAKGPTEDKRFLPAEPAEIPLAADGGIFEAVRPPPCCPQTTAYFLCFASQSENCLGLSVFTPTPPRSKGKLLPVIVYIHGGGFTGGSSSVYTAARLLEERDVILVSFNYRLGALGFFCLNHEDAPGNAALYDMREALLWVKTYIEHFGGDPNMITIAGQSAGSAAVSHLMTSPLTRDKGLFHRAIAMSGTVLNEWATTTSEKAEEASLKIAEMMKCYDPADTDYKPAEVIKCMQDVPAKTLATRVAQYQAIENNAGFLGYAPISPVIQKVAPRGGEKFIDERPENVLVQNKVAKVPFVTGSTRHDGSFVLGVVYKRYIEENNHLEDPAFLKTELLPQLLTALGIEDKTDAVFDAIANTYLGLEVKNSGNLTLMLPGLTDMFSVLFFKSAALRTLKLHSRNEKQSYWYNFDYRGRRTNYGGLVDPKNNPVQGGVAHSDELIYIFSIPYQGLNQPEELAVSKRLVDYWVNFAYTGNPNIGGVSKEFMLTKRFPEVALWETFSEANPNFAIIDVKDQFIAENPNDYWLGATHELYPELNPATQTTAEATTSTADASTPFVGDEETTVAGVKTTVAGVETTFAGVETTVAGVETTFAGVETTVAGVETTVAGVETTFAGVETTVAGVETTVAGEETTVAGVETTVAGVETTVAGGETTVAGVETTVAGEETTVAGGETTAGTGETSTGVEESSTGAGNTETTTNNSPVSTKFSYVVVFVVTTTFLAQAFL